MPTSRPFIPRDKPKSFVIFSLAGLVGLGAGLVGYGLGSLGFEGGQWVAIAIFTVCWAVGAGALLLYTVQYLSGAYEKLEPRPWSEQKW